MLEDEIISSVYSEKMYNRVKFLEVKDFEKKENRQLWMLIQKYNGDVVRMMTNSNPLERSSWTERVRVACLGVAWGNVDQVGLKLIEMRFTKLLIKLLDELIGKSRSAVERHYLEDLRGGVSDSDIFDLIANAEDYLTEKAQDESTPHAKQRLKDLNDYVLRRIEKIKELK
jgi:hypothetical protein